jgi:hypothetical protein
LEEEFEQRDNNYYYYYNYDNIQQSAKYHFSDYRGTKIFMGYTMMILDPFSKCCSATVEVHIQILSNRCKPATTLFSLFVHIQTTQLENTTYNILAALGRDADFLYDTIGTYIKDAQNANRSDLVTMWEYNKTR